MRIGILGSGLMGGKLGTLFARGLAARVLRRRGTVGAPQRATRPTRPLSIHHGQMSTDLPPLDAFAVAAELFGDRPLTTGQLTQLRALDHRYWQEVYTLLHPDGESPRAELTAEQRAELRGMLVRNVRELATPAQRAELGWT